MSTVADLAERKESPPLVRFERTAKEDKAESKKQGKYVARDVDMVLVTPPYSKDVFKKEAKSWFDDLAVDVANERIPASWVDKFKDSYERWKSGQELPLDGTPIRGWGVISPAQQENLIRVNILTVEDLSKINDEGTRRVGMGATELKNKALAWLAQLNDKGPLTQEMAELRNANSQLTQQVGTLTSQVEQLMAQLRTQPVAQPAAPAQPESQEIAAGDILEGDMI